MEEEIVAEIHFTSGDKDVVIYSVSEFVLIEPSDKVMMTIGENNFDYFDAEKNHVSIGKALMYLARKRREYLDSEGIAY